MTDLEMAVSSEFAKVRGAVRLARGGGQSSRPAGAHFLVGLRGGRGSFSSPADENGVFAFDKVIPGEYRIAAWRDPDTDVSDEEAWAEADSVVRDDHGRGGLRDGSRPDSGALACMSHHPTSRSTR